MSRHPVLLLAVQIAAVTAILGCLVALASLHPRRIDLTPERRFTLSGHTREVLRRIEDEVRITVFFSSQAGALRREMGDLLGLYADAQPRIALRFLDLDRSPGAAKRLGVTDYNTAVVEAGPRRQRVELVTEDAVTAALLAVAGTPPVSTWFVVGHGERDPRDTGERTGASELARALAAEGFQPSVLEGAARIPAEAHLVVLAGPTRDLRPPEIEALVLHVGRGGSLLVLVDPAAPASVAALLARFGIELGGDVVVDERGRLFGTDGLSARVAYLNERLLPVALDAQALLPEAQSLRLVDVAGARGEYLATTAEDTWADVDRRALEGGAEFRPERDRRGPLPVAALVRVGGSEEREGRVVVIGDADLATNLHLNLLGNRDLLLAAAGLAARGEALGGSRPAAAPGGTFSPLTLTAAEARRIFWGVVVVPTAALAAMAVLLARRRRYA